MIIVGNDKKLWNFTFSVTVGDSENLELGLSVISGSSVVIDWGDGNKDTITYSAGDYELISNTYISAGTYDIIIKDSINLYGFYYADNISITFNSINYPRRLTYFYCTGSNTISGDVTNLPSGLTTFYCTGSNTISGDVTNLPSGLTYFRCTGSNTINDYTSPTIFSVSITYFLLLPVGGLSETEVDNLLIDLDASGMSSGTINISGNNAARTAASDAAVTSLQGKGVTVTTN